MSKLPVWQALRNRQRARHRQALSGQSRRHRSRGAKSRLSFHAMPNRYRTHLFGISTHARNPQMSHRIHIGDMSPEFKKKAAWWGEINQGIAGDVGPFTCWTTKNGKTVFIRRAPPDKPPSEAQKKQRLRFRLAFQNWKLIPEKEKESWRKIVEDNRLCLSAHNLFISLSMTPDPNGLAEKAKRAGVTVQNPPPLGP